MLDQTVDTLTAPNALVACNPAVSGTEGGHDCNPLTLLARGAVPVGRLTGWRGTTALFADDLETNVAKGLEFEAALRQRFDEHGWNGAGAGLYRASGAPRPRARRRGPERDHLGNVFRPDYSWIELPVFDPTDAPCTGAASPSSWPASSAALATEAHVVTIGVGEDAEHVVAQLAA